MNKIKVVVSLILVTVTVMLWFVIKQEDADADKGDKYNYKEIQNHLQRLYMRKVIMDKDWSEPEVKSVLTAVKEVLEEIVFRAFKNSGVFHIPRDQISKYVTIMGSMAEGTKITSPDEFDFEVYFPHFSNRNINISWDSNTENCAKMKYIKESYTYLHDGLRRKVIHDGMVTKYLITLFRELVSPVFNILHHNNFFLEKEGGTLSTVTMDDARAGKICLTFHFLWRSHRRKMPFPVKVDCVPGIFLSSPELSKRLHPVFIQMSYKLHSDLSLTIPSTHDLFKVAPQHGTFTFCPSYSHMQLNIMLILTKLRKDLTQCYKLVKYFNPETSPVSSTEIKSVMIHDILSHIRPTKYSMAKCVIELIEKVKEKIDGKTCQNVHFPDILFGYSIPVRMFKCRNESQLFLVSQSFAEVVSHLKDVN